MLHHRTTLEPGDHYAVSVNGTHECVLVQLQHVWSTGHCEQVRVQLTADEARHMAGLLLAAADRVGEPDEA